MASVRVLNVSTGTLIGVALLVCSIGRAAAATGEEIYRQQCIACHGANGIGDGPHASTLKSPPNSFKGKDLKLSTERAVAIGIKDIPGHKLGHLLTRSEVESLIDYVDSLSRGQGAQEPSVGDAQTVPGSDKNGKGNKKDKGGKN